MKDQELLDHLKPLQTSKYGMLSFKMFIAVFVFILLLITISILKLDSKYLFIFLALGPLFANIMGVGFSIVSLLKGEPNTTYKLVGAIGNFVLSVILLGLYSFIYMDMTHAMQNFQ